MRALKQFLQLFLSSPALAFALSLALFFGNEGGTRLVAALLFLLVILLCQALRAAGGVPTGSRYRALLTRPSTQQVLVALLCLTVAGVTIAGQQPLATRDMLFVGTALFAFMSNLCTARMLERGFAATATLSLSAILLVPQFWSLFTSGISMFYNGGLTMYGLPLLVAAAWCGIFGRFGPYQVNAGMPFYISALYQFWYAGCNILGPNTNSLIVLSCAASALGSYMLACRARSMAAAANITPAELLYVELPGVVYRAPRFVHHDEFAWQPVSFRP